MKGKRSYGRIPEADDHAPEVSVEVPRERGTTGNGLQETQLQQFMKSVTDQLQQQQQMFSQLQQIVLQLSQTAQVSRVPEVMSQAVTDGQLADRSPEERGRSVRSEASIGDAGGMARSAVSLAMPANAVNLLALQIPEYSHRGRECQIMGIESG